MRKYIIANLKMNILGPQENARYLNLLKKSLKGKRFNDKELIFCPPFVQFESFKKELKSKSLKLGAQNIFWEKEGAYTGEISASMAKNFGCEYTLVGHSERRAYFGETDGWVNRKIHAALKIGIKPIICIGETLSERKMNRTQDIISQQLRLALKDVRPQKAEQIIIAYEPIWSVGTDVVPTADEVMSAKLLIRKVINQGWGRKYAELVPVVYGGSVDAKTVTDLCVKSKMDGVLVGRQSLYPSQFVKIAEKC